MSTVCDWGADTAARERWRFPAVTASKVVGGLLDCVGGTIAFARNGQVFAEREPANYLYEIRSGCVRTYSVLSDGRRQIGSFYFPGDYLGLEAADTHAMSAEAVTACRARFIRREPLQVSAAGNQVLANQLLVLTTIELQRTQAHMMLLLKNATERVAGFLMEIFTREGMPHEVRLSMNRQDIADYLGVTIETVSRMLSRLERAAIISMPTARRVVMMDLSALALLT